MYTHGRYREDDRAQTILGRNATSLAASLPTSTKIFSAMDLESANLDVWHDGVSANMITRTAQ